MVTSALLPRAALGVLSSTSGVMTLSSIPLEGSPAAHLLSWQSRRFSFVLRCISTFHGEVKAPKVAVALRGVTKHKLSSISHVPGHRLGWRGAQAPCCLLGCSVGGKEAGSNTSLIFGSRSLKFLFIIWSSNTLLSAAGEGAALLLAVI